MTLKAVTFDFWSTLYKSSAVDYDDRINRLNHEIKTNSGLEFSQEQVKAALKVARDAWNKTWIEEYRTLNAEDWLTITLDNLGVTLKAEVRHQIQSDMENSVLTHKPTLAPDIKAVLAELASRYKLAIISDTGVTSGHALRLVLEQDKLLNHFSHLTFSDEIGRSKPHAHAFLSTLEALAVKPSEAVHVGDLLRTDIAGAQAVGMKAVQFAGINRDKGRGISNMVVPDALIYHHQELIPLLKQWTIDNG